MRLLQTYGMLDSWRVELSSSVTPSDASTTACSEQVVEENSRSTKTISSSTMSMKSRNKSASEFFSYSLLVCLKYITRSGRTRRGEKISIDEAMAMAEYIDENDALLHESICQLLTRYHEIDYALTDYYGPEIMP